MDVGIAIKCVIVGDSKSGKTDLFLTFTTGSPSQAYSPTVFDTFTQEIRHAGETYSLALWDSAGDSLYDSRPIRPISFPHTDCFIICYASDDQSSYENVERKWIPEIKRFGDALVPIIVAELKCDLKDSFLITKEQREEHFKAQGVKAFFMCSTHTTQNRENVEELFKTMIALAVDKKCEEEKPPNPIWAFEDLKIVLVGDTTVGKSSILAAATSKKIKETHEPTTDVVGYFDDIVSDGVEYFLGLYDLPSTPQFLHDRIKEYGRADGVIAVYSINDPFSFQNLACAWIPEIQEYAPNLPFFILGNKLDLKEGSEMVVIPSADGEEMMLSTGAKAFLECSAKSLQNVPEIFKTAVKVFGKMRKEEKDTAGIYNDANANQSAGS